MRKRLILLAAAGLLIAGLFAARTFFESEGDRVQVTVDDIRKEYARLHGAGTNTVPAQQWVPIPPDKPVRLAVAGMGLESVDRERLVGDLIVAHLDRAAGLELIDRQSLNTVLREINLSVSGFVRAKDAVRVGKLLRADWFLMGTACRLGGTNSVVVRVVDARSGILCGAGALVDSGDPGRLAADIAALTRRCRASAAADRPPVYLAMGALEDLSLNDRFADFPKAVRNHLTAAFQAENVTLLEREYADVLLREVRLDLAGLIEGGGTQAPVPMQSALWLLNGYYQAHQGTGVELELVLSFNRIFGRSRTFKLRGPPEELPRRIKAAVDEGMRDLSLTEVPTRASEVRSQLAIGRDLAAFGPGMLMLPNTMPGTPQEMKRLRRNLEEAMRAFQTVLLLEPNNREAKMSLAACCQAFAIGRLDEAREFYREIVEEPVQDQWTSLARFSLANSFQWGPMELKRQWFETALQRNVTNPAVAEFYRTQLRIASDNIPLDATLDPEAGRLAERRLFDSVRDGSVTNGLRSASLFVFEKYVESFGTNRAAGGRELAQRLPGLQALQPDFAPHMLAGAAALQTDTSAPIVGEFKRSLDDVMRDPKSLSQAADYFELLAGPVYRRALESSNYVLAVHAKEAAHKAGALGIVGAPNDEDKLGLAFAYLKTEQWRDALAIFQSYSNRPVLVGRDGLWGRALRPVLTSRQAAFCREKLGLPADRDPREFTVDHSCTCLHSASAIAADDGHLWIGIENQLIQVGFDLKTNAVVSLPKTSFTGVSSLCLNDSTIWIGTQGDGLIEVDKKSHQCTRRTAADGLAMDFISCLRTAGDILWIGYGFEERPGMGGGLGRMNIPSRSFTSFTPSFEDGTAAHRTMAGNTVQEPADRPTRRMIRDMTVVGGSVWMLIDDQPLRRYRIAENAWEAFPQIRGGRALANDAEELSLGEHWAWTKKALPFGLNVMKFATGQWTPIGGPPNLTQASISALAVDGSDLWIGGVGYVAVVDRKRREVKKFAYITTRYVDQIEISGGYAWLKFDNHLFRVPLSAVR